MFLPWDLCFILNTGRQRSPAWACGKARIKQAEQLRQSSAAYRYLLFNVRLAVGNELLMLTLTEPFFCVLRTTRRARPFHVLARGEV